MKFLVIIINDVTSIEVGDFVNLSWHTCITVAIHEEKARSHNGLIFAMGKYSIINGIGNKKKMKRSSTEGELSASDERLRHTSQPKKLIECQDFNVKLNILF